MQLRIGMIFPGYCGGAFGRDAYGPKRVEGFGVDWIVARTEAGQIVIATFAADRTHRVDDEVALWLTEKE